jgi:RluA family pseudouridine synthase
VLKLLHRSAREVHRDEWIWVIDKPAGVLSHPNQPTRKASNALLKGEFNFEDESYTAELPGEGERKVWLLHRLDLDTSGLIVCAFDPEAAAVFKQALHEHEVEKAYKALLLSAPKPPFGCWSDCLARSARGGRVDVRVRSGRKANAETSYELERTFPGTGLALVRMMPHTGRTHQLRVQAAWHGVPVIGDPRYGDFEANRFLAEKIGLKRMFLHAWGLAFRHPITGHRLSFTQELSQRLRLPLERLERLGTKVPRRQKPEADESGGFRRRRRRRKEEDKDRGREHGRGRGRGARGANRGRGGKKKKRKK